MCLPFFLPDAMLRPATFPLILLAALSFTACNPEIEDDRPGQPVKHRREAFKALLRATEPFGRMLDEGQYSTQRLAALKGALVQVREEPWNYYGPDTNYPPSKSRPEVWSQPEKFEAERQRFFTATDALLAADSEAAVRAAYDETRATCKSCHDAFRR
ncbi:MAG: cytochrome c [Azoarcus sp.]|jgi:cytochrome c556|nr:cytochrome c [Azoarcus sp.]